MLKALARRRASGAASTKIDGSTSNLIIGTQHKQELEPNEVFLVQKDNVHVAPSLSGETSDESYSSESSVGATTPRDGGEILSSEGEILSSMASSSEDVKTPSFSSDVTYLMTKGPRERTSSSSSYKGVFLRERATSRDHVVVLDDDLEMQQQQPHSSSNNNNSSSNSKLVTSPSRMRRNPSNPILAGVGTGGTPSSSSWFRPHGSRSKDHSTNHHQRGGSVLLRRLVDGLQSIRVRDDVYLVSGLDRVLLYSNPSSTSSGLRGPACAETVLVLGVKPPRYLWYMLSGSGCDVLQFATLYILHHFVVQDPSVCWCLGFLLSIPCRHTSHRYLVFGDYVGGYWRSLARMYAGYSVIIVLSTLFNLLVSWWLQGVFAAPVLWLLTMLWTGVANYFILKRFWSFGGNEKTDQQQ